MGRGGGQQRDGCRTKERDSKVAAGLRKGGSEAVAGVRKGAAW